MGDILLTNLHGWWKGMSVAGKKGGGPRPKRPRMVVVMNEGGDQLCSRDEMGTSEGARNACAFVEG